MAVLRGKCSSETVGNTRVSGWMGVRERTAGCGGTSSALQLANRTGAGRLETRGSSTVGHTVIWVAAGRLRLTTVQSAENVADVLTKHVSKDT